MSSETKRFQKFLLDNEMDDKNFDFITEVDLSGFVKIECICKNRITRRKKSKTKVCEVLIPAKTRIVKINSPVVIGSKKFKSQITKRWFYSEQINFDFKVSYLTTFFYKNIKFRALMPEIDMNYANFIIVFPESYLAELV